MRSRTSRFPLAGMLCLLLAAGCANSESEPEAESTLPITPVPLTVATVRQATLEPSVELVGSLAAIPERTASITSQTNLWIDKVLVVEGSEVRAGDTLVQLDARMANVDRDRARAAVDQKTAVLGRLQRGSLPQEIAAARLEAEKAGYSVASLRTQLAGLKELLDKSEVSPVQYENVRTSLQVAEATQAAAAAKLELVRQGSQPEEIAEAKAQLAAARADLAAADLTITLSNITSPIDGTVTHLSARIGALADATAPLATVADLSSLFARVQVPSADQTRLAVGAKADVSVGSVQTTGSIIRISSEADPATGNVEAFALIENGQKALRPGFVCTVRVWLPPVEDALVIPTTAVADRDGTPVVTVVRAGKAHEVEVKLGVQTRQETQVLAGLSAGDTVATKGGYGLPDGCPVEVHAVK